MRFQSSDTTEMHRRRRLESLDRFPRPPSWILGGAPGKEKEGREWVGELEDGQVGRNGEDRR